MLAKDWILTHCELVTTEELAEEIRFEKDPEKRFFLEESLKFRQAMCTCLNREVDGPVAWNADVMRRPSIIDEDTPTGQWWHGNV